MMKRVFKQLFGFSSKRTKKSSSSAAPYHDFNDDDTGIEQTEAQAKDWEKSGKDQTSNKQKGSNKETMEFDEENDSFLEICGRQVDDIYYDDDSTVNSHRRSSDESKVPFDDLEFKSFDQQANDQQNEVLAPRRVMEVNRLLTCESNLEAYYPTNDYDPVLDVSPPHVGTETSEWCGGHKDTHDAVDLSHNDQYFTDTMSHKQSGEMVMVDHHLRTIEQDFQRHLNRNQFGYTIPSEYPILAMDENQISLLMFQGYTYEEAYRVLTHSVANGSISVTDNYMIPQFPPTYHHQSTYQQMHHSVPLLEDIQNASLSNISSRMIEEDELQRVLRISLEEEQARLYSTTQREREQREAIERANEQAMHLALQQSFEEFNQQQLMGSPSIAVIQQANLQELEVARMASLMDRYESNERNDLTSSPNPIHFTTPNQYYSQQALSRANYSLRFLNSSTVQEDSSRTNDIFSKDLDMTQPYPQSPDLNLSMKLYQDHYHGSYVNDMGEDYQNRGFPYSSSHEQQYHAYYTVSDQTLSSELDFYQVKQCDGKDKYHH